MLNLGFTMEELMFPENYRNNFFLNIDSNYFVRRKELEKLTSTYNYHDELTMVHDDDDDDWFTIKQLKSNFCLTDEYSSVKCDQIIPCSNFQTNIYHVDHVKSTNTFDNSAINLLLPNSKNKMHHDKNDNASSETILQNSSTSSSNSRMLNTKQYSDKHVMTKSVSDLSFTTQSSTSMTNSSIDELSSSLSDFNEITYKTCSNKCLHKLNHQHKRKINIDDDLLHVSNRRRRKRTIFSAADIQHLKQAFILNPKPTQQDIAILSEQLGHDSYVIRVWFYNKRQAAKKRTD